MDRYITLSKNIKINDLLKDFNFIFNDETSKKVFEEFNKDKEFKSYILDKQFKNSKDKFFIGDKDVYMIYVLPKLLELGVVNIAVYNEEVFPEDLQIVEENISYIYNSLKIDKEDIFIITKMLVDKIKYGAILAKKIVDADISLVAIEIDCNEKIYEIAGAIKNLNKDIKITLIGKTDTPKKFLMTNPVDFLIFDKSSINQLLRAIKKEISFANVDGLYYYDENLTVKFNI